MKKLLLIALLFSLLLFLLGCSLEKNSGDGIDNTQVESEVQEEDAEAQVIEKYPEITREVLNGESYTACGCGCCGENEPQVVCLYKERGEDLRNIIVDDTRVSKNVDLCSRAGCSQGVTYTYCD